MWYHVRTFSVAFMANSASCLFFLANIVTLDGEVGVIDSNFLADLRLEESDISAATYEQLVTVLVTSSYSI